MNYNLRCIRCGREYDGGEVIYTCECGGLLEVRLDISSVEIDKREYEGVPLSVWKYKKLIPIEREPITIKEGERLFTGAKDSGRR
jgi:Threonine synthase